MWVIVGLLLKWPSSDKLNMDEGLTLRVAIIVRTGQNAQHEFVLMIPRWWRPGGAATGGGAGGEVACTAGAGDADESRAV